MTKLVSLSEYVCNFFKTYLSINCIQKEHINKENLIYLKHKIINENNTGYFL